VIRLPPELAAGRDRLAPTADGHINRRPTEVVSMMTMTEQDRAVRPRRKRHVTSMVVTLAALLLLTVACRPPGMVSEPALADRSSPAFPSLDGPTRSLVDVRAWPHPGFDRVVLEFSTEHPPSWQVREVAAPPREPGRGDPVAVSGAAFLEIRATPASAFDWTTSEPVATYLGPERLTLPGSGVVTEIVAAGEMEQTLVWVIGLRGSSPFAAVGYEAPGRIVVDVLALRA
jgi:hypothetical protein